MKSMLVLASSLFALTSTQAFAVNTNGVWTGSGKITNKAGQTTVCESMVVTITHTATLLKVDSSFTCKGEKATSPGGALDIRNGSELWEKGARIGTITPNSVVVSVKDAEHTLDTKSTFTEKEMTFNTVSTYASMPGEVITFIGTVRR